MRISDWSSDVCSSDLGLDAGPGEQVRPQPSQHGVERLHERRTRDPALNLDRSPDRLVGVLLEHLVDRVVDLDQIGRASGGGRVCQDVSIPAVAVSLNTKQTYKISK